MGDDSFEKWLEHFEERAVLAGWSEDQKKYLFKMHLDKTAFQSYCMLSKETKQSYSAVVEALRKRFHPVDIEELRGAEFYQVSQKNETVELGIKLQTAARKAFPSLVGKEHDRLLKGRFFQSLLTKWQRKLGAPKSLFNRARTVETHDQQYSQSTTDKSDVRKEGSDKDNSRAEPQGQGGGQDSTGVANVKVSQNQYRSDVCYNCEQPGYIARYCRKSKKRSEAIGRHGGNNPRGNKVLVTVADMSDTQLEQELADRKLAKEQQLLSEPNKVGSVNVVEGAVGPTLMLELSVEGLQVTAVVDTASNSTIISRSLLHDLKNHLQALGRPIPKLELPCVPLYGKEGTKGKPLDITAQVPLTFACDGRKVTVPTFIQPESEQKCLIGMNVIPFLGITVRRANGKPLHAIVEHDAQVRLVQTNAIPSLKGRVVEAQLVNSESYHGSHLLFQPEHKILTESLITVEPDGKALFPIQNFQGILIKLDEGVQLGVASLCDLSREDEPVREPEPTQGNGMQSSSVCACVQALSNSPERYQRLLNVLDLPDKLNSVEAKKLKELMTKSTDIFALDESELGCTDVVYHKIDTGDKPPVKQHPYRTPMIHREKIAEMVNEIQERGIVQPSASPWASPVVLVTKKDGSLHFA